MKQNQTPTDFEKVVQALVEASENVDKVLVATQWYRVNEKLPDRNTKYAGSFGVSVLGFDEDEYWEAGFTPAMVIFNFEKELFQELASGSSGSKWIDAPWITHWCALPSIPTELLIQ